MKKTNSYLKKPLSRRIRPAQLKRAAARRLQKDLDAVVAAYLEAGHLSASDLKGEIAVLRSVLRRVFALASEESEALEAREAAQQQAQSGLKIGEPDEERWIQARFLLDAEAEKPAQELGLTRLALWVGTLESLSRGAMRLANLMRTQQALNRGESEVADEHAAGKDGEGKAGKAKRGAGLPG